jgi:pseudaminic acid cytidylyltransferase
LSDKNINIAIIPARSGSKRVKNKNIKIFNGKPILAWSIKAALCSQIFDKVIVSTDSIEISNIAKKYGAECPFLRPMELSDDYTVTQDVVKHAVDWYGSNKGHIDNVCCIYATTPFLTSENIRKGYEKLIHNNFNYVFSAVEFNHPIQRAFYYDERRGLSMLDDSMKGVRTQDLEIAYHDAAQFYWGAKDAFINDVNIFSNNSAPLILPKYMVCDIDTEQDWEFAVIQHKVLTEMNLLQGE